MQWLIKADKYQWLLQKATELGASSFIAVSMEHSIVKLNEAKVAKKIERWQKIIKEAAEQSYRLVIPSIQFEWNLKLICDTIDNYDYILIAYEEEAKDGELSNSGSKLYQQFNAQDKVLIKKIFGCMRVVCQKMKFHYLVILVQLLVLGREFYGQKLRHCMR